MSMALSLRDKNALDKEYPAVVYSVDDTEQVGKIQVIVKPLQGDEPFWVSPEHVNGAVTFFNLPEKNDIVQVKFPTRDMNAGVWFGGQSGGTMLNHFKEGYPHVYGMADKYGNVVKINKQMGTMFVKTNLSVTVDSPTATFTGNVIIQGNATIQGNLAVTGTSTLTGTTTIEGKSFLPHTHTSAMAGSPTSGVN